jgi:anhydro-N-acetylmuramic acid kinase
MISGTSHDGIDVAAMEFTLSGDDLSAEVSHHGTVPYEPSLRVRLLAALPPAEVSLGEVSLGEVCALDTLIGKAFASAAPDGADLIFSHGQTVFHWPGPGTLQIGQPAWIAEHTWVPVVSDVRVRDMAAGGQGAPLVALLDSLLLAGLPGRPAALNLGGIANITVPGPSPPAYDIGRPTPSSTPRP